MLLQEVRTLQREKKQQPPLEGGEATFRGVCALSMFDGIGCAIVAMKKAGIPVRSWRAVEWDAGVRRVAAENHPACGDFEGVIHEGPQDVMNWTEADVVAAGPIDVLVASPPCTDLSRVKVDRDGTDHRLGLAGPTGQLFVKFLEIFGWVRKHNPDCKYIVENVDFEDRVQDWATVCAVLGTPVKMNARDFSYTHRRRVFWTNASLPQGWDAPAEEARCVDDMLDAGRHMLNRELPTVTASWIGGNSPVERTRYPLKVYDQLTGLEDFLRPPEAERLIGLPEGYTDVGDLTAADRCRCVGNGIDVRTLTVLMYNLRWGREDVGEASARRRTDAAWLPSLREAVRQEPALCAENMVKWLTPGECPIPEGMGDQWKESWMHPTVRDDVKEWVHGASLRFEGDRSLEVRPPNHASAADQPEVARKTIWDEVVKSRLLGPFVKPPLPGWRTIPRALVDEMERSGKFRPISDYKSPRGMAVNEGIPDTTDVLQLVTHTELRRRLRMAADRCGGVLKNVQLAKRDIKSAYRNVRVRPEDWHLCGVEWDGQFFVDAYLSFGCRSSVDKFLRVSDAVEWVLRRWGVDVVHYIDDFIFIATSDAEAAEGIRKFEIVCAQFGLPIKQEKDVGPGSYVEVLGVVYDLEKGVVEMPARIMNQLAAWCQQALDGPVTRAWAQTVVGVMQWAAQCMPQARPFVSRLRRAAEEAKEHAQSHITRSQKLRADLQWWVQAIAQGMGAQGVAVLQSRVVVMCTAQGDAGSAWGLGGYDAEAFYNAPWPQQVMNKAMRKSRPDSKYMELFQTLVMARMFAARWAGAHIRLKVDNYALVSLFRKMSSSTTMYNDMVREIALLQVLYGWTWEVVWVPREQNEAADALSKNEMNKFYALTKDAPRRRLEVPPAKLLLPLDGMVGLRQDADCIVTDQEGVGAMAWCGSGRRSQPHTNKEEAWSMAVQRPVREVFADRMDGTVVSLAGLEDRLRAQLSDMEKQIKDPSMAPGVVHYLKFARNLGWNMDRAVPEWREMQENLKLWLIDAVQQYAYEYNGKLVMKRRLVNSSVGTYLSHINAWYAEETGQARGVTSSKSLATLRRHLAAALPQPKRQKDGIPVQLLRRMVHQVRAKHGMGSAQEAAWVLAWITILRPGEFTTTAFDVSTDLSVGSVRFYNGKRHMPLGSDGQPNRMVVVLKQSKQDQLRLTADLVVGATGDATLCAVAAMWRYLSVRCPTSEMEALFVVRGSPWSGAQMRTELEEVLLALGENVSRFGGHSFRVGGAQALAAAGKSVTYIMAYGRWKCVESVMRYVKAPDFVRLWDAIEMVTACTEDTRAGVQKELHRLLAEDMQTQMHGLAANMVRTPPIVTDDREA